MSKTRKKFLAFLTTFGMATVLQVQFGPSGCNQFIATGALSAFDFCSVLNCTGGAFFNFCNPVQLLIDCQ